MKTGERASGNPRPRGVRAWRRTLDAEAAPAPAMCCLAAGTSRDQSALAEVRSMVARTKVADCGQTGAEGLQGYESISHSGDFFLLQLHQTAGGLITQEEDPISRTLFSPD